MEDSTGRAERSEDQTQARRTRGVRLNDLDRSTAWVIAYTGRRWEVFGPAPRRWASEQG